MKSLSKNYVAKIGDKETYLDTFNLLYMSFEKIVYALNSDLRREILVLLCKQDMTATQLFSELKYNRPRYRQSVNKALEILKESELVKKYYDDKKKALYYRIMRKGLTLNLENMSIE